MSRFEKREPVPGKERLVKTITPIEMKRFGLSTETQQFVDTLEDLTVHPPNIVVGECVRSAEFIQNQFRKQHVKKKLKYVMSLGVYEYLHYDVQSNNKIFKPAGVKFKNVYRPYRGQDLEDKTLLIWRTGGIGDLEFILPNIDYLKEEYPSCRIELACGPQYQSMVDNWPSVDEVIDLPFQFGRLIRSDYHAIFEGVIERCGQAKNTNAYTLFSRWLGLDLPKEMLIPRQDPKPDKVEASKKILDEWGIDGPFIILQMRASSPIRTPRGEVWKNIIDRFNERGHKVVITDAPHQAEEIDKFMETLNKQEMTFNFAHRSVSLDHSIALTSLAEMAVATDTALMHIAASLDVKCFGLYGPFPGHIRLSTYPKCDWIDVEYPSAPCFLHGHKPCPHSIGIHPKCYDTLDYDEFIRRAEELYES